jgi:hypothetical protein
MARESVRESRCGVLVVGWLEEQWASVGRRRGGTEEERDVFSS